MLFLDFKLNLILKNYIKHTNLKVANIVNEKHGSTLRGLDCLS